MRIQEEEKNGRGSVLTMFLGTVFLAVLVLGCIGTLENLDASQIMVVQSPIDGTLTWHTTSGVKWQGFGKVTKYQKRDKFWFSARDDQGTKEDESIKIRFNDNGHANISGSIDWEMPTDSKNLTNLHTKYSSHHGIQQQVVRTVIEKAVYMTGPLMSSKESAAERRNDLLHLIEDQVQHGIYRTETVQEKTTDIMTGQPKTINIVKLLITNGVPARADRSILDDSGIKTYNLSINNITYDQKVEAQIQQQQQAMMQVQTAMAKAKEAEQEAITVAKKGEAEAMKAKWEQETIKAKLVTEAQQKLEVAQLAAQAAEQTKQEQVLLGEGEAARKKLNMEADGALQAKLDTYYESQKVAWAAIGGYEGSWVPSVIMGAGGPAGSGAMQMMEMISAKYAKDLALDMTMVGQRAPKAKKEKKEKK